MHLIIINNLKIYISNLNFCIILIKTIPNNYRSMCYHNNNKNKNNYINCITFTHRNPDKTGDYRLIYILL